MSSAQPDHVRQQRSNQVLVHCSLLVYCPALISLAMGKSIGMRPSLVRRAMVDRLLAACRERAGAGEGPSATGSDQDGGHAGGRHFPGPHCGRVRRFAHRLRNRRRRQGTAAPCIAFAQMTCSLPLLLL